MGLVGSMCTTGGMQSTPVCWNFGRKVYMRCDCTVKSEKREIQNRNIQNRKETVRVQQAEYRSMVEWGVELL